MSELGPLISTFSIVGFDPSNRDLGVAVATKYLAVGSSVPFARPEVGAIAVQAYANPVLGPEGLKRLSLGLAPHDVVDGLMDEDERRDFRQLGVIDAKGCAVTYTGAKCEDWAGGGVGPYCAAQGNMLVGEITVRAMIEDFTSSEGRLADRLVNALRAGERAGGDKRGRQSSALLVVSPTESHAIFDDNLVDLRVDSHPQPCRELQRLLDHYYQLHESVPRETFLPMTQGRVKEIQLALHRLGRYEGDLTGRFDRRTKHALEGFCVVENQKERYWDEEIIDPKLLRFLIAMGDGELIVGS